MKKVLLLLLCAAGFGPTVTPARGEAPAISGAYMEALESAVAAAMADLQTSGLDTALTIAVVPMDGDDEMRCYDLVQIGLTAAGYKVFNRQPHEWQPLLEEISWGQRRGDIMDAETIQRFGEVKGVDAVLYGRLLDVAAEKAPDSATDLFSVRLNLHASVVETGEHAWGTSVVGRSTPPAPIPFYVRHGLTLALIGAGVVVLLIIGRIILRASRPT